MALEAKNIYYRYNPEKPWILENVSLKVNRQERLAMFAPSGYGKTTLALLLAGYLKADRGEVLVDGSSLPKKGVCPVQLIHQHPEQAINPRWKLRKVLEESGKILEEQLEAFGIQAGWLERFPGELSGGELQRFCVARALMSGSNYLICDEISTMLDAITQAGIWKVILEESQKKNMGILMITHNRHLAERIATRTLDFYRRIER